MSDDPPESSRLIGPSLQPDDVLPTGGIGPAIPAEVFKARLAESTVHDDADQPVPVAADLDTIGPLIPGQELHEELRHLRSDAFSASQPFQSKSSTGKLKRESWMTELLPISGSNAALAALKPRKFSQASSSNPTGCDSSWFRAPNDAPDTSATPDVLERQDRNNQLKRSMDSAYDEQMQKEFKKSQKSKSLLDLHQKNLKREEKKKAKKAKHKKKHKKHHRSPSPKEQQPTRRPFDRDKDLKTSCLDAVARNKLIQHSKQLSSKFAPGSRQFL